jgi:hypothetical protein
MAGGAPIAERFMLENEGPRLLPVALGATLVQAGHGQAAPRLHDVVPVRIVALRAIHPVLDHRVMLRQVELRVDLMLAFEAGIWIFARVDNEATASAASLHMLAARAVTRFASSHPCKLQVIAVEFPMRAGGEDARDVGVAVGANPVADEFRPFNPWREHRCAPHRRTSGQGKKKCQSRGIEEPVSFWPFSSFRSVIWPAAHRGFDARALTKVPAGSRKKA